MKLTKFAEKLKLYKIINICSNVEKFATLSKRYFCFAFYLGF